MFRLLLTALLFSASLYIGLAAQTDVAALVDRFQEDVRGPYRDIAWFCADGNIVASVDGQCATPNVKNKQQTPLRGL